MIQINRGKRYLMTLLKMVLVISLFSVVLCPAGKSYSGEMWIHHTQFYNGPGSSTVRSIARGSDHTLWFGTATGGVSSFDGRLWTTYSTVNSGIPGDDITAVAVDLLNRVWCSCKGKGVSRFDGKEWKTFNSGNSGIAMTDINAICADSKGNIWFGGAQNGDGICLVGLTEQNLPPVFP